MKYAQFAELCRREWMHGEMDFRDVVSLTLSGPALAELTGDVLAEGPANLSFPGGDPAGKPVGGGAMISEGLNPITRSIVRLSLAAEGVPDTYTVSRGPAGYATFLLRPSAMGLSMTGSARGQ